MTVKVGTPAGSAGLVSGCDGGQGRAVGIVAKADDGRKAPLPIGADVEGEAARCAAGQSARGSRGPLVVDGAGDSLIVSAHRFRFGAIPVLRSDRGGGARDLGGHQRGRRSA